MNRSRNNQIGQGNNGCGHGNGQNNNNNSNSGYVEESSNWRQPQQQSRHPPQNRRVGSYRRGGMSSQPYSDVRAPLEAREHNELSTGSHLSKTTSTLNNDPLYLEAFFPAPSEEMRSMAEEVYHYPGLDGLTPLINETYKYFCAHNLSFKLSVSLSMYAYYIATLSWARMLKLKMINRKTLLDEERQFVKKIYEEGYILPKTITLYLSGLGNFTIPNGVESLFNMKEYTYSESGYFDNFENLFNLTTSYPQIALYAERIQRDIIFTDNPDVGEAWAPNGLDELNWNTRCLGYAGSKPIQMMQREVLNRAGVTKAEFSSRFRIFPLNIGLLKAVQKYLAKVPSLEYGPIPENTGGSQGQFIIEVLDSTASELADCDDVGVANFVSKTPLSVPGPISYLGGTFLYRIDKKETPGKAEFLFPFMISNPTEAQINLLDSLNIGWSPIFNKKYHYENLPFEPNLRIKNICSIDLKVN